jgi:hypothetical protein
LTLSPSALRKRALVRRCRAYLDSKSPAFREAMPDGFAEASAEPSPTPETTTQEPELTLLEPAASAPADSMNGHGPSPDQVKAFVELWNTSAPQECARVRDLTAGRIQAVLSALRQQPSMAYWEAAMGELRKSTFLRGLSKRPGHVHWRASFDWFLESKNKTPNYVRVAEGAYRDHAAVQEDDE